jgi:hypothetical protein
MLAPMIAVAYGMDKNGGERGAAKSGPRPASCKKWKGWNSALRVLRTTASPYYEHTDKQGVPDSSRCTPGGR